MSDYMQADQNNLAFKVLTAAVCNFFKPLHTAMHSAETMGHYLLLKLNFKTLVWNQEPV